MSKSEDLDSSTVLKETLYQKISASVLISKERVAANPIFGALLKQVRRTPLPYKPQF